MNSIINELKTYGVEFKKSRVVFADTFNCLDIFKNGERIRFISPNESQPLIISYSNQIRQKSYRLIWV